ncbi:MAG TPA: hypothetical protein VND93_11980 [Myxococcales bacterium]|nr:hypothetical protein [Myxococcales bacterium]
MAASPWATAALVAWAAAAPPEAPRAPAPAPAPAPPADAAPALDLCPPSRETLDDARVKLEAALNAPDELLGKLALEAFRPVAPRTAADFLGATLPAYCPRPEAAPAAQVDCARADVRLRADGSLSLGERARSTPATIETLCLDGSARSWGARVVLQLRNTSDDEAAALCFDAEPGATYQLPRKPARSVVAVRAWANRGPEELAQERNQALADARDVLARLYELDVYREWVARVAAAMKQPPSKLKAAVFFNEFSARVGRTVPGPVATGVRRTAVSTALEALRSGMPQDDLTRVLNGEADGKAAVEAYLADTRALIDASGPTAGQLDSVLRRLALAYQPSGSQWLPWHTVELRVPASGKGGGADAELPLLSLDAFAGKTRPPRSDLFERQAFTTFAYDLRSGQSSVAVMREKALEAASSPVLEGAAQLVALAAQAAAVPLRAPSSTTVKVTSEPPASCTLDAACLQVRGTPTACQGAIDPAAWKPFCEVREAAVSSSCGPATPANRSLALLSESGRLFANPRRYTGASYAQVQQLDVAVLEQSSAALRAFTRSGPPALETAGSAPSARYTAVVGDTGELDGDAQYEFRACSERSCDASTDPAQVTASMPLEVVKHHAAFSVAVDVAYAVQVQQDIAAWGGYVYQPIGGGQGPDALYELQARDGLQYRTEFAAILYAFPAAWARSDGWLMQWLEHVGVGVGPSLFRGDGGDPFKQWNFKVALEPPVARGLLLNAGASIRLVQKPRTDQLGTIRAVPLGQPGPTFAADDKGVWAFSLGISVDTAAFTGAVKNAFDALFNRTEESRSKEKKSKDEDKKSKDGDE